MGDVPAIRRLAILSGPSGSGKGTITPLALEAYPELRLTVSVTTRPPRAEEVDGVAYHFWTVDQFQAAVEAGLFLEWAQVHQTLFYGTLRSEVSDIIAAGFLPLLEIDVQGALNVKEQMPEALLVFLKAPPGMEEVRLRGRGTESEEQIQARLHSAEDELKVENKFDSSITNDDLSCTVHRFVATLRCYFNRPLAAMPSP